MSPLKRLRRNRRSTRTAPGRERILAAYGGVYIVASLFWLWAIEGARPDRWDVLGGSIALIGAGIIIFGPRS